MADELEWILSEDGCINVNECISSVIYHPTLNVILVITKESNVKVLDVCAGILLHNCALSACYKSQVSCTYIPGHDKVLFTDGRSVGLRRDHNGVLLLDTILQARVGSPNDVVRIELLFSEAVQLLRCLQELDVLCSDQTDEVRTELESKIAKSEVLANENHKVVKWCTVCLELPHNILKAVFSSLVQELKRLNRSVPSLSIASAVSERLNSLLPPAGPPDVGPNGVATVDRSLMFSEMARRETFGKWPHMNYKWALPDQMAQAGFYHQSNSTGDDRAMCFTCTICLVCWEPTDEPWSEHERHSPSCPFVKGEYTQNVPLSVTNATSPAVLHSDRLERFGSISVSTYPDLVATSTENGSVVVWNIARSLKKEFQFKINPRDHFIVSAISASRQRQTKLVHSSERKRPNFDECDSGSDEIMEFGFARVPDDSNKVDASLLRRVKENDLTVTALAILGSSVCSEAAQAGDVISSDCQPLLIVGASIGAQTATFGAEENPLVQVMNDVNQTSRSLDIMKMEQEVRKANEDAIIGQPHPSSSKENNHYASAAVPATSGLYLLHCILGWQPPHCSSNHGGSGAASSTVDSSSKSSKGTCRDNNRLLCHSLGMLLSDDSLDASYGLNSFGSSPSVIHMKDHKNGITSFTMEVPVIDNGGCMADNYEHTVESAADTIEKPVEKKPVSASGHIARCLELPGNFDGDLYSVSHVVPTIDDQHILVIVGLNEDSRKGDGSPFGALFIYHLERREDGVALVETPTLQRTLTNPDDVVAKVILLPEEVRDVQGAMPLPESTRSTPLGFMAVVTRSGSIQVIDLSTLEKVGEMVPQSGTSYVAAAYCASIERICASTSDGNLRFLQLWPKVRGGSGSVITGAGFGHAHSIRDNVSAGSGNKDEKTEDQEACQMLVNQPLTFDALSKLHDLTHFTNLTPRFAATLPACWSEIQQEQKQRRHPQHLQQQGESNQHTRSWRLQPDSNTSEEHLFEITLPRACCVGHIDFKFNLQPAFSSPPNIQVTLLKQNSSGLGKKVISAQDSEVDSFIDLNIRANSRDPGPSTASSPNEKPNDRVLNPDFLKVHNAEIVCGPLPLSSYIDLSGQSGIVTFTSPALLQTKARTFLIHLKNVGVEKEANNGKREVPSTSRSAPASQTAKQPLRWQNLLKLQDKHGPVPSLQSLLEFYVPPGSAIELLAASAPNRKTETPKGCDLFHEISITVRSTKVTHIANERFERLAMLSNTSFYERLIAAVCSRDVLSNNATTLEHQQHLALDILNWIASIQSGSKMEESESASSIFPAVQANLDALIKRCFLDASRSIAHKCSKLIVFSMEFQKGPKDQGFDVALLRALLLWLPSVVMCKTAGAMHWFFILLNRVKFLNSDAVGQECLSLLVNVVRELDGRTDPLHALLRARFGLYRTPFELELFEVEAPLPPKPTSTPVTYAAVVGNGGGGVGAVSSSTNNNNGINVNQSMVMGPSGSSGCPNSALSQAGSATLSEDSQGAFNALNPPTLQLRGLLEVEPLHFTCHAASDGTKVERVDPGLLSGSNNSLAVSPNMTVYVPFTNGCPTNSSSFTKHLLAAKKMYQEINSLLPKGGSQSSSSSIINSAPTSTAPAVAVTPVPVSPWQHFLHPPPQQALVIERMHSGARRFVVLDFGKPIYLTDLMIPSCPDLVSLSIDIWTEGEEVDGQRLVVSTDIWFLSLIMNDLLPPPRCRFLKITAIGRYGMSTTRCRIPMGTFYGHTTPLPWLPRNSGVPDSNAEENSAEQYQMHLNVLSLLLEDIHCRYSLACDKLHSLLGPLISSDRPVSGHVHTFIQREQGKVNDEEQRVFSTYRDCIQLQQQFNLAAATVERLKRTAGPNRTDDQGDPKRASTDKLRVLSESLLVALLGMTYKPNSAPPPSLSHAVCAQISQPMCELLFRYLAIGGSTRFQAMANALLVRTCGLQPWWGSFVAKMLVELYHSQQTAVFPQDRVFLLLVSCHDKGLLNNTLPSILELLQNLLAPIIDSDCFMQGSIDLSLVGWVLLFISFYVDIAECKMNDGANSEESEGAGAGAAAAATKQSSVKEKDSGPSGRWDFIQEEWSMLRNQSNQNKMASHRLYRRKLQKRLMYHKQQLENLEQVKKSYLPSASTYSAYKNQISGTKTAMDLDTAAKQHEQLVKKMIKQHTAKHFKDMVQIRRSESASLARSPLGEPSTSQDKAGPSSHDTAKESNFLDPRRPPFRLPRSQNLKVAHGLAALLLSMDYTCNVDMFLLTCKVLAKITTFARPAIGLGEIVNQAQLDQLLLRCVGCQGSARSPFWGGPWAGHAITCLLQDIVEGEKLYPIIKSSCGQERSSLNDIGLVDPHIHAAPVASASSSSLDDPSLPGSSNGATAVKTTDADKMTPMQMQSDATLAGLIKLLDVDSDDTSSDEIPIECNDSFSNIKFSPFPLKKSWTIQNNKSVSVYFKNSSTPMPRMSPPDTASDLLPIPTVSAAVDARLELGVDVGAELRLRTMAFSEADIFFNAFFLPISAPDAGQAHSRMACSSHEDFIAEAVSPLHFSAPATSSSVDMLAICFDNLFQKAGLPGSVNLESLLQLWITLNEAASDQMGSILPLSLNAATGILAALSWHPTLSLRTWYLAFRALQLPQGIHSANASFSSSAVLCDGSAECGAKLVSVARAIASDNNLLPALIKFLSYSGLENAAGSKFNVGPSVCLALCNFLTRLLQVCNNLPPGCRTGLHLKTQLLKVVHSLVSDSGPIRNGLGPLDAQCRLVNLLLTVRFDGVDSHLQKSVVKAVSSLVHMLIHSGQMVSCRSSTESDISDTSCFGGILRVLPRNSTAATVEVTQSTLVHALLSLCIRLVQSPCGEAVLPPPQPTQPPPPPPQTENTSTPLTDTLKMEQRTSGTNVGQSSGETSRQTQPSMAQTDEHKSAGSSQAISCSHAHSLSPSPKQKYIADEVLHHQQTMMWLLQSLSSCSGSTMAMLLGPMGMGAASPCTSESADKFFLGEPVSVGDLIFQLLCTLNSKASNVMSILQPILAFLSSGISDSGPPDIVLSPSPSFMSEPLLWLIMRILDCEPTISEFLCMGGIQLICKNLVSCHRHQVNTHPSLLSVIMQKVNRLMVPMAEKSTWSNLESVDGLVNFAPLGTISLKDPTIQPADILIQPTPPHRRARTPAWSYHFYPEESWVDLTITLPCAILLREVHIQPHLASLATCPSSVALEISSDGASPTRPLCPPLSTSGLTFIRQQLSPPEITTTVVVRLYKPRDSSNIGLSQILLLGTSAFGDSASGARLTAIPTEESVAKSSVGWLRLLHHFLIQPCDGETLSGICGVSAAVPGVLQTCCSLLLTPTPELYTTHIELVLLHLGRHSIQVGLEIINILLKMCSSPFGQGNWTHLISRTPANWATMDSVMDIVFLLCTTRDSSMANRISALLDWLLVTAQRGLEQRQRSNERGTVFGIQEPHGIPTQAFIHCFASILWYLHESGFRSELSSMFNVDIFRLLYDWSACLSSNSNTRRAVNSVFSSICYIRPDYFTLLMEWMGFVRVSSQAGFDFDESENFEAPITDDSKEIGAAHQVKESGGEIAAPVFYDPDSLDLNNACLNSDMLSTLAAASQSPQAIGRLIESGLPRLLARSILDFCLHEGSDWTGPSSASFPYGEARQGEHMTDADKAGCSREKQGPGIISGELLSVIIQFFTEVCGEGGMRDWLGGAEGSSFWLPLLQLLCLPLSHAPCFSPASGAPCTRLSPQQRATLESATIQFLSRCCWCHLDNQQLLAQVLCEVISKQSTLQGEGGYGVLHSISGFARRLILQLLLENEKILVFVKSGIGLCSGQTSLGSHTKHPRFGCGHRYRLIYANTQMTCADILRSITGDSNTFPLAGASVAENRDSVENPLKDLGSIGLELVDYLSVAAGVLAKDKRQKTVTKGVAPLKSSQGGSQAKTSPPAGLTSLALSTMELVHEQLPDQPLPSQLTLSQLLTILEERGDALGRPYIVLSVQQSKKTRSEAFDTEGKSSKDFLLSSENYPSALQVFASVGGLALLAPYLPVLYPDMGKSAMPHANRSSNVDKTMNDLGSAMEADWVKVEAPDEMFDDFPELLAPGTSTPRTGRNGQLPPSVPPHSLAAFGLFLRLPSYAETLLKERQKAQCLLRLALGVTDNGEGVDIFSSPVASSLPTLPFQVLRQLFDSMPLTTDDGVLLRRMALDVGAVHLLLACLSILSHQKVEVPLPGLNQDLILSSTRLGTHAQDIQSKSDDKSHLYWAKGTGFGTGSTAQSWDVEQAISRQKSEEEHVTCLLQVLASYINPRGVVPFHFLTNNEEEEIWLDVDSDDEGWGTGDDESTNEAPQPLLPTVFPELLAQSCVFNTVSSYLRNDSVLDMARHVPLYRALLQLLRAMAVSSQLVGLLLPSIGRRSDSSNDGSGLSIVCLLTKMKACVDTYASRLRLNKTKDGGGKTANKSIPKTKEEEESEGLALLIPDVQETARIVETATARLLVENEELMEDCQNVEAPTEGGPFIERQLQKTLEERYLEVMKRLQFDTFEMIVEDDEGFRFTVPHHFESNMRAVGDHSHPSRARRLAQEAVTLSTSLPLSYSSSVYVRCDQDRLDLMKVLITGPEDTPYANGCFEFDVYFPPDYPNSPMLINLETTGHHTVRFNPNLYNDGKVCLSILNTWHGRPEEKWNPHTSSFLQVLVSIQSLILVQEPYFNEPGYERSRGTTSGQQSSREYDSNIRQATVKWAMLEPMKNSLSCFKEVIHRHFWMKRAEIVDQCQTWIVEMEAQGSDRRTGRTVALNCQALKRHFAQLKEEFLRMKPPAGLEDLADTMDWQQSGIATASGSAASPKESGLLNGQEQQVTAEESAAAMDGFLQLANSIPDLLPPDEDSGSPSGHSQSTSLFCGPI